MELNNFVKLVAEQFEDTDISEIHEETCFQELDEWSSLTTLSIIASVRVQCGKQITAKDIRSCRTVKDLFNLVYCK